MKAISGYAEWFWLMAKHRVDNDGWKDVENRNWSLPREIALSLPYRIYLHASKKPASQEEIDFIARNLTEEQWQEFSRVNWNTLRGHIIGEITIVKQIHKTNYNPMSQYGMGGVYSIADLHYELVALKKDCPEYFSKWFFGKFGFVVRDGKLLDTPIPYKGQLGFFEVKLAQ